jgi:hypothetical protein
MRFLIIEPVEDTELPLTCMFTSPLYTEHMIDLGTYISGVGLGRLASNSDSDRLAE